MNALTAVTQLLAAASAPWKLRPNALTNDDVGDLHYLIHDKDHISDVDSRLPALDKALKSWSQDAPTLYRGIYQPEIEALSKGAYVSRRYMSMSEDVKIAKLFASATRRVGVTPTILKLERARGFAYWQWMVDQTFEMDKSEDPTYLRKAAKKEKEWILPRGVRFAEMGRKKIDGGSFVLVTVKPQ